MQDETTFSLTWLFFLAAHMPMVIIEKTIVKFTFVIDNNFNDTSAH